MKSITLAIGVLLLFAAAALGQKKTTTNSAVTKTAAVSAAAGKCPGNGLTAAEAMDILAAHNRIRAGVKVKPLHWDCSIAQGAQSWANKSVPGHNDATFYGENIFVSLDAAENPTSATDRWDTEKANWTNKTATCAPGKTCTHYTQIVWSHARKIGCGINRSATGKWKLILVCNYDSPATGGKAYPE